MLDRIRPRFKLETLSEPTIAELNLAWHQLDMWPDVESGFARLHHRFLMAPCSNGNIALMADVARRNDLPWDAILGSEIAQGYKPQPKVYLASGEALNLKPGQVHDVCRPQRRPRRPPRRRVAHRPCRAAGRRRSGHR